MGVVDAGVGFFRIVGTSLSEMYQYVANRTSPGGEW